MSEKQWEGLFGPLASRVVRDGLLATHAYLCEADQYLEGLSRLAERKIGPQLNIADILIARLRIFDAIESVSKSMMVASDEEMPNKTPEERERTRAELAQASAEVIANIEEIRKEIRARLAAHQARQSTANVPV